MLLGLPAFGGNSITGAQGLTASVDPSGTYDLFASSPAWHFHGNIGYPLSNVAVATGADAVGNYSEISFDFLSDAARHAAIRLYGNRQIALFTFSCPSGAPNTFSFPNWTQFPQSLDRLTYSGIFAPPSFNSSSNEGPWVFFDSSSNAFIMAPAAHFMVAVTGWGPNGELASGVSTQIATFPQSFQHRTLLVIDAGINRAFDSWGRALTSLQGKARPPNDADIGLTKLGYWTDNGATYYYQTANGLSYEQTLSAIKADFDRAGVGLGSIQLDSWFYPKGPNANWSANGNGIYQYIASPTLFPDSLASFQNSLGVSLITHARWIDPSSPYHQLYKMSGNVVTDMAYWNTVAQYLAGSGVSTYEQDWLDDKAHTDFNLTDPDLFLDNMGAALARQNITVQYCMASPRHFLHSVRHNNVTTIRASEDRMTPARWTNFLYTSRLASALGLWPFTDILMSSETSNLLLATLSAGPVGLGDAVGALSSANLLRAARADGMIVKPDVPLVPIDSSYFAAAHAPALSQIATPQIASTYSDFGGLRAYYVFAYSAGATAPAVFRTSDFGMNRPAYLYDYSARSGQVVNPSDAVTGPVAADPRYWIAAPIGHSGMAILGDLDQFVPLGKKRITALSDEGVVHLTIAFAPGEKSRSISGYSPVVPAALALSGAVGPVHYDAVSGIFQIAVEPATDGTASIRIERKPHPPLRSVPPAAGAE